MKSNKVSKREENNLSQIFEVVDELDPKFFVGDEVYVLRTGQIGSVSELKPIFSRNGHVGIDNIVVEFSETEKKVFRSDDLGLLSPKDDVVDGSYLNEDIAFTIADICQVH